MGNINTNMNSTYYIIKVNCHNLLKNIGLIIDLNFDIDNYYYKMCAQIREM